MSELQYFSVLSSLELKHGGLTTASLRRVRALSNAGRSVGLLVANYKPNFYDVVSATENGMLDGALNARNMFYDLVAFPEIVVGGGGSANLGAKVPEPVVTTSVAGSVVVTNYSDHDGNLRVTEANSSVRGERSYTIYSSDSGQVLLSCSNWELRRRWCKWIDSLSTSVLFIDGVSMAQALAPVRFENSLKYFMQHGAHSTISDTGVEELHSSRVQPFRSAETFDRFIVQTVSQRDRVVDYIGDRVPVNVISNVNYTEFERPVFERQPLGVVCTRFDEHQKRISDLLSVMVEMLRRCSDLNFEVFGDGEGRWSSDSLASQAAALGFGSRIVFRGFVAGASANYSRGLFTLMTSRYEGFPLNLVEASSLGCVPISYDIDYGPSDLIEDGVNGFLVPDGDREAMVQAGIELVENSVRAEKMAVAAVSRARDFGPDTVISQIDELVGADLAKVAPLA